MIVITGGAGFIGSFLLAKLEEEGCHDLVVSDWLGRDDKWKNIAKRELRDIITPEDLPVYLEKHAEEITAVVHMGAVSTTTEKDVDLIVRSNQRLTSELWDFCSAHGKQFIYASSAATYGAGENGFYDWEDLEYLNKLRPLNPYGWSKAFFDRKVARCKRDGRPMPAQYVGLKFFNVYGPNEYHKGGQKSVIAHIFPVIKRNEEVKLFKSYNPKYADGWQLRDFVWVGDIARVIIWLLENKHINGLFNVGTGKARSFYDLAKAAWTAMAMEPKIGFKEMPEELRGKYQYYTQANMGKLYSAGYPYKMTQLEDGVREYVVNYLNKEDPYI